MSHVLHERKFEMEDIQNATIAGGVIMGSACEIMIMPWAAVLTGCIAGIVSTLGYKFLTPLLNERFFMDTCGVHNLHGMPGFLGGIASAIAAAAAGTKSGLTAPGRVDHIQGAIQLAATTISFGIGFGGGALTGMFLRLPFFVYPEEEEYFNDTTGWHAEPLVFEVCDARSHDTEGEHAHEMSDMMKLPQTPSPQAHGHGHGHAAPHLTSDGYQETRDEDEAEPEPEPERV